MPVCLRITVSPGARKNQIERTAEGLRIKIAAPPAEGKANAELIGFLAKTLSVPRSAVCILKGTSSRHKLLAIEGIEESELRARLGLEGPLRTP